MGDEWHHVNQATGHQIQHRLEIALLSPAHEADRVILPALLVGRIVAARTVGAADLEAQFLGVQVGPRQLEPRYAHQYDATTLATYAGRLADRLVTLGGGRDDD